MAESSAIRARCDSMRRRLAEAGDDRHILLNVATVLVFVFRDLQRVAEPDVEGHTMGPGAGSPDAALRQIEEDIGWIRLHQYDADPADIQARIESALTRAGEVLEAVD